MSHYKKVDMENWVRREHYLYYTEQFKIEFNMTVPVDITNLLDFCHTHGYRFYPSIIYVVTKVLNQIENFKMFKDEHGDLCVWDKIVPNYTIFHEDDKTFSDCWTDFSEDFNTFYSNITGDMERYKDKKGIKVKEEQPANFYCISCMPWIPFTSCHSRRTEGGEPAYFPIVAMGKYEKKGEKVLLPVNITIAHAVCDGYHAGLFFESLQKEISSIS